MKRRMIKKQLKRAKAKVANIALGYVPNSTYRDLYRAIGDAEHLMFKLTETKSPKIVLMAHIGLEEMWEVRELAHKKVF